jgi:SAM-dependent methyltransferase
MRTAMRSWRSWRTATRADVVPVMKPPDVIEACPACRGESRHLLDWEFSGLGDSVFNYVARYHACGTCGLVHISNVGDERLARFYAEECGYFDSAHFDVTSPANIEKYAAYKAFLVAQGRGQSDVTDIGCGRGGFLVWLKRSGWDGECCGVDVDAKSSPADAAGATLVRFQRGGAFDLPFGSGTRSLLTYFHVLEHIRDVDRLLAEVYRVLEPGGYVLIEVPDAENYHRHPIGSAFWVSIREHVHHFSACALAHALQRCGMVVVKTQRGILPTPEFSYPSLMVLGRKAARSEPVCHCSPGDVASFVLESRGELQRQAAEVSALLAGNEKVTIWGCSAELLSLLPLLDLRRVALCDSSKLKQRSRYKDLPIRDPRDIRPEGVLVVAPYLHREGIERAALDIGWRPDAIHRLW